MLFAALPLLFALAQAAFIREHAPDVTHGDLKSDKKFFGKDYPFDRRPAADKYYQFSHPYPAVQDSGDYDADFVKDENSDGGRWQAQMEYDTLRAKIRAAKEKLGELKEKMEKEYEEWMRSKVTDKKSSEDAEKASKDAGSAKSEADKAEQKVNELEGHSGKDGTKVGGKIGDAVKKVQKEMDDLEKCKKTLAEAKSRLKKLLKEKEDFEIRRMKAKAEKEKKKAKLEEERKKRIEEKKKRKAAGEKAKDDAEDEEEEAAKKAAEEAEEDEDGFDEEAWNKKLTREKNEHAEALNNYNKELNDVKKTEDQLARAAENLRKFRRPPYVDANGGVYNEERSSAFSARVPLALVLAVFAALTSPL